MCGTRRLLTSSRPGWICPRCSASPAFITIAESLDIPAYALKRLLNHKTGADVTAGYIVIDVKRLREPMQKITDFILKAARAKPSAEVVDLRKADREEASL